MTVSCRVERIGFRFILLALVITTSSDFVWSQVAEGSPTTQSITLHPLLRDCTSLHEQQPPDRIVLQVIENTLHKWREHDLDDGGFCVVLEKPRYALLAEAEASVLMQASMRWVEEGPMPDHVEILDPLDPSLALPPAVPGRDTDPDRMELDSEQPDTAAAFAYPMIQSSAAMESGPYAPEVVIGTDDRVRVTETTGFPWRTIAFQSHGYSDGSSFRCTAFLITPHVAMTNGHCTWNASLGGWATSYAIAPGQRQDTDGGAVIRPYGLWTAVSWTTNQQWVDTEARQYDYAISTYTASFSNVSNATYMPLVFNVEPAVGNTINVAGYPGTAQGNATSALWRSAGEVHSIDGRVLRYLADTSSGNSGGPVWEFFAPSQRQIIAVHSFGSTTQGFNGGPRLVQENLALIESWMGLGLPSRTLSVTRSGTGSGSVATTVSPGGINCGTTCSADFFNGSSITLTQTPAPGSQFTGWSGACSGTQSVCTVSMSAARSVTASFSILTYALTVVKSGSGSGVVSSSPSGINCGTSCTASFNDGTTVVLTATPQAGSLFDGWSGACTGKGTCTVSMTQARSVTANFSAEYSIEVIIFGDGDGRVTSSPPGVDCVSICYVSFPAGASVTLTAHPAIGSSFSGWRGDCDGSDASCVLTMNKGHSIVATFSDQAEPPPAQIFADGFEEDAGQP